jgi:hypothetical protein
MTKDYCTSFPDKIGEIDISLCCKAHDKAYELQLDKPTADVELFNCVADAGGVGILLVACLMFFGVSVFGWMFYKKAKVKE